MSDSENTRLAFSLLRIMVADETDISEIRGLELNSGPYRFTRTIPAMLNTRNERRALSRLNEICDDYLSRYPTTLEQDVANLASNELPMYSNRRNAVIQVKGEKEILHVLKKLVQCALRLISAESHETVAATLGSIRRDEYTYVQQYCEILALRLWRKEFDAKKNVQATVD